MYCLLSYDLFKQFSYNVVPGHIDIIHNIKHQKINIDISDDRKFLRVFLFLYVPSNEILPMYDNAEMKIIKIHFVIWYPYGMTQNAK